VPELIAKGKQITALVSGARRQIEFKDGRSRHRQHRSLPIPRAAKEAALVTLPPN